MNTGSETVIPGPKELRQFGFLFALILVFLFGLLIPAIRFGIPEGLPFIGNSSGPVWPWWVSGIIVVLAAVIPASLVWLYRPWMKFAAVAQWINTRLILLILFYLVILPIGLLRRLLGKDSMQRKLDKNVATYRTVLGEADFNDMGKPY